VFQIEKAEYKGICEWSRDGNGGITGFKVKIHLEFKKFLGIFDQDPGDLILDIRYVGLSGPDSGLSKQMAVFYFNRSDFYVNGKVNYAHLGLETIIKEGYRRHPILVEPQGLAGHERMAPAGPLAPQSGATPEGGARNAYFAGLAGQAQTKPGEAAQPEHVEGLARDLPGSSLESPRVGQEATATPGGPDTLATDALFADLGRLPREQV
jgi:hypothetical protein